MKRSCCAPYHPSHLPAQRHSCRAGTSPAHSAKLLLLLCFRTFAVAGMAAVALGGHNRRTYEEFLESLGRFGKAKINMHGQELDPALVARIGEGTLSPLLPLPFVATAAHSRVAELGCAKGPCLVAMSHLRSIALTICYW